jgi:shikimate kinase
MIATAQEVWAVIQGVAPGKNIILIGMPGVGKSTVGVLLAKLTSREFIDTDVMIQAREGRRLQEILDREGKEAFCRIEEKHLLSLDCRHHVVATGGSVVYSDPAMQYLKRSGVVVYMTLPLPLLEQRLTNLDIRGVVREAHQTIPALFEEREPLYRKYADVTVDCTGLNHEQAAIAIVASLNVP